MKKILLVEDSDSIILGLKYSLEQENFNVEVAKTEEDTKKIIEKENFDLILFKLYIS